MCPPKNPGRFKSGDLSRTSTQEFHYLPNLYRGDLIASSDVEVGTESSETVFAYDSDGFLVSKTTQGIQTQFAPDNAGNVQSVTDPNGHVTSFTYQWGTLKNTQTPEYTISRTIDQTGVVESETRRGSTVTYSYDLAGRVIGMNAPGYDPVSITYSPDSVQKTQGASSAETDIDGFGREIRTDVFGSGVHTTTQYDVTGRTISQSAPTDASATASDSYAYDDLDRLIGVTHSGGGTRTTSYTGTTVVTTDENGRVTTQHLARFSPGDGRITAVTDPAGQTWQYTYNMFGSLKTVTQPGGAVRTFQYNALNRLTSETHPESGTTTYGYDDVGNLTSKQDARGISAGYTYDDNNRLTAITGLGSDSVSMAYDDSDNRVSLTNGTATSSFSYNTANQLVSRTDTVQGRVFTTTYGYDSRGNLTSLTYPSGRVVRYDYDAGNRVTRVYDGATGSNFASGLAYHPAGSIKALQFGNGTSESATFDGRYRLSQLTSGPLSLTYAYDPGGNVTSITDARPERSASFSYDALDRLRFITGWGQNEYQYDALGNRTWEANSNVTSSYNAALRLTQTTGPSATTYGYDSAGHQTSAGSDTYQYDAFNMLRAATVNGIQTTYGYDGDSQRVMRTGPEGTTYTIRFGSQVLAEYKDAGGQAQLLREQVYLGGKLIASIGQPATGNSPVSVTLTSPSTGTTVNVGVAVTFSAQAQVAAGGISQVEFYRDGLPLGSDSTAPYSVVRSDLPVGTHRILARAVATSGSVASSAIATLTIVQPNAPPTVSLTAPVNGAVVGTGMPLAITATASDADGIQKVEFYRGSLLLDTDTTAPYAYTWPSPTNGSFVLTAKAYDTLGLSTTSAQVSITVQPVATITVAPTSPTAGSAAVLTIDGAASCTAVRIYFGDGQETTLLDDGGLPITTSYAWATTGPKSITALGLGGACESQAQKTITVLAPPSVSITSPATGAIFSPPATVAIAATASAAQGTIAKVDFFANGSLLNTDTSAPYAYSWPSVPAGTYALTARATDTMGAVSTSSSVTVIVGTPPPSTVLGVSVSNAVAGQAATVTVIGTNPCAWVWLEFGDGDWWLGPIGSLPYNTPKTWAAPGTYTVLAKGWDTCGGEVTSQVTVHAGLPSEAETIETPDDWRLSTGPTILPRVPNISEDNLVNEGLEHALERAEDVGTSLAAAKPWAVSALRIEPTAQAVTIYVDINGTGSGSVSGPVSCSGSSVTCPAQVTAGQGITLTATASPGSVFTGWTGVCATTNSTCGFSAASGLVIIANFQATSTPVTTYYHLDTLGSVRAITDASGAVLERHDFRPFGEDTMPLPAPGADPARFLGQQRDSTKLDQFGARYYSMFHGRFTGVDPIVSSAAIVLPQKWNRYAYGRNNPLRFSDPAGLDDEEPREDPATGVFCLANCKDIEEWDKQLEEDWWRRFELWRAEEFIKDLDSEVANELALVLGAAEDLQNILLDSEIRRQIANGELTGLFDSLEFGPTGANGRLKDPSNAIEILRARGFRDGPFWQEHAYLGPEMMDFRSPAGSLGLGSLQIVFSRRSGRVHVDVDMANPYDSVPSFLAHALFEWLPYKIGEAMKR